MSRTKPIRDLWFRFARDKSIKKKLNAQDIAQALSKANLIELVAHRTKPTFEHYVDSKSMKAIPKAERDSRINEILESYAAEKLERLIKEIKS